MRHQLLERRYGPNHSFRIQDVQDASFLWQWLEGALIPATVIQEDQLGHALPTSEWGYMAQYNRIIGGVRLIQDRSRRESCSADRGVDCYPHDSHDFEPFGYPPCSRANASQDRELQDPPAVGCYHPEMYTGAVFTDGDEGFVVDPVTKHFEMWLDVEEPRALLKKRLTYLEDRHWIDRQTKSVIVELLVVNEQYEPLLCEAILEFVITRTGYIEQHLFLESVPVDPYLRDVPLKVTFEVLYGAAILFFLARLMGSWAARCRAGRSAAHAAAEVLPHNFLDVLNIVMGFVLMGAWLLYVPLAGSVWHDIQTLQRPSENVTHSSIDMQAWDDYHHHIADTQESVESCIARMQFLHRASIVTVFGMMAWCFKVWEGIPSLASVKDTLAIAFNRLIALFFAGGVFLGLFASVGMLLFGHRLEEFSSFEAAAVNTALAVVAVDSAIYEKQAEIDPVFAAVWFWPLMFIMFVVLLNMVLGVLVDAASTAASQPVGHSISLKSQAKRTAQHYIDLVCCGTAAKDKPIDDCRAEEGRGDLDPTAADLEVEGPRLLVSAFSRRLASTGERV